jgi:hypothetical protein
MGTTASSEQVIVIRCSNIQEPNELIGEADFGIDRQSGSVMFSFSEMVDGVYTNTSHTVSYRDDPTCRRTPWIADLLDRIGR